MGANFSDALLHSSTFYKANLIRANFRRTNLSFANLSCANLLSADFTQATLCDANLQQAFAIRANLSQCDLRQANLSKADLEEANLNDALANKGVFYRTNLRNGNLARLDALEANLEQVILTGACLEDWKTSSATDLSKVTCDYIYLKEQQQERRPHNPDTIFAPGEFTQRFQKLLETVDLFFVDGVDWKAFLSSFQDLQTDYGDEHLAVQGIERKGKSDFEIRLAVSQEVDKAEIERVAYERYEVNLNRLKAEYQDQIAAREGEIVHYRQQADSLKDELLELYRRQSRQPASEDMLEIVKLMASRPINVEAKAVVDKDTNTTNLNVENMAGALNTGSGTASASDFTQDITNTEAKQTLAEAAAEIQALLKQLEQTAPANSTAEKMLVAVEAVKQIEGDPSFKQRVVAALSAGGMKAFEAAIDHPLAAFLVGAIEGWKKS